MSLPQSHQNEETDLGDARDGYPALASWISRDPDSETYVFRKFNCLIARIILHHQCQLIALEKEIDELDQEARRSDLDAQEASKIYETLIDLAKDPNRIERKRVEKLDEAKRLLTEYHSLLLQQSSITSLSPPNSRVLSTFRTYLAGEGLWKNDKNELQDMPLIYGLAQNFLSEENEKDLVALKPPQETDFLTRLLQNHWSTFQRNKISTHANPDPTDRTAIFENKYIIRTVALIDMLVAAILLIVAITSLYIVENEKAKLGLIAVYTVLFAVSVALLTKARRAEVFAATAAYAAVLVVFVSGDFGGERGKGGVGQCMVQLQGGIWRVIKCPD